MFNSSVQPASQLNLLGRKTLLSFALAALLGALSIAPAFADRDGEGGRGNRDHREWRGDRDHRDRHEWRDGREWRGDGYGYQPMYRRPYMYAQPVYVPPPVYYEPRQSPGVSLFFPLDLRR